MCSDMGIERGREEATQDPPVRVLVRQQSLMARIKLTHEKTAKEPTKFMQIWRWEFANADHASILILWEVSWPGTIWGTCSYLL